MIRCWHYFISGVLRRLLLGRLGIGSGSGLALDFLLASKYFLRGVSGDGGTIYSFFFGIVFKVGFGVGIKVGLGVGNYLSSINLVYLLAFCGFSSSL